VAQVVGGTQPSAAQASVPATLQPYWFSGADTGDGSGVAGVVGCFSLPQGALNSTPVGMVLPAVWKPLEPRPMQGRKFIEDEVRVRILTGHDDITLQMALLVNFRDTVELAFNQHMQLFNTPGVLTTNCREGTFLEVDLGGTVYLAVEFNVFVQRGLAATYVA
jgi:hypothetical protein